SERLLEQANAIRTDPGHTVFENRRRLARLLGARHDPDRGTTSFGFWAPDFSEARLPDRAVALEIFTPLDPVDFTARRVAATFRRDLVPLLRDGDYWWGVLDGVRAGTAT